MNNFDALAITSGEQPACEQRVIDAWQHLIDEGMCDTLPGSYGRQAQAMIDEGVCRPPMTSPAGRRAWANRDLQIEKVNTYRGGGAFVVNRDES